MLKRHYYRYSMIWPGLVIFVLFFIAPALAGFFYAFTNMDQSFKFTRMVGFYNFIALFSDSDNTLAFKNTFIFATITTVFKTVLGLLLALFVNMNLKSSMYLRSVLFLPVILSTVAVALAFNVVFHPSRGILNVALRFLHLDFLAQAWLTNIHLVMYSISFVEIWKWTGFSVILFLAALQSIPKEVVESSLMDGASSWKQLQYIKIPMILPVLNTSVILSLIGGLKVFDIVYALTGGGPGYASRVINSLVYDDFTAGRNGEAAAANVILFLGILIIVLLVNKVINKDLSK